MKTRSILTLALFAALAAVALPAAAGDAQPAAAPLFAAAGDCAAPAAAPSAEAPLFLAGEVCGSAICGKGTYCCNASCSRCVPFGMSCTQEACNATEALADGRIDLDHGGFHFDQPCGNTVCTGSTFCCNASCSICAPRGGACTQQICPPTS